MVDAETGEVVQKIDGYRILGKQMTIFGVDDLLVVRVIQRGF